LKLTVPEQDSELPATPNKLTHLRYIRPLGRTRILTKFAGTTKIGKSPDSKELDSQ